LASLDLFLASRFAFSDRIEWGTIPRAFMVDEAGGKRKRHAPARLGDYADDDDEEEHAVLEFKRPTKHVAALVAPVSKERPPAPIKLTITAPTPSLSKEEESLMAKYVIMKALLAARRERGMGGGEEEAKPATVAETELVLAELAKQQHHQQAAEVEAPKPRAKPSARRPKQPSFASEGSASLAGADDDVGYAGVDEFD